MKSALVIREPNCQLPEGFKQKALEQFPSVIGYASPQGDESIHNAIFDAVEMDLADAINKIEDEYKGDRVFYNFLDANVSDREINLDSIQPFNMITDGEENATTLLSVMVEGEFPKYENLNEDGEPYSPEYHFANNFLGPLIDELWDMSGKDIDLFMSFLGKDAQKKKIVAEMGPRATVLFIPYKGLAHAVSQNDQSGKWTWGFSTRSLGYTEEKKEEEKPSKPLSLKEQAELAKKKKEAKAEADNEEAEAKEHPPGGTPITAEEKFSKILKNKQFFIKNNELWVKPPAAVGKDPKNDWKEAKNYWNRHTSLSRPEKPQEVYAGFPASKLRPNSPLHELMVKLMSGEADKAKPKEAESEQGPAVPARTEEPVAEPPAKMTLLIPSADKAAYFTMKKANKLTAMTDDEILKDVDEYPFASLALGEESSFILRMTPESFSRLSNHLKACIFHELRCRVLGLAERLDLAKEEEKKEVPAEETGTNPNQSKPKLSLKEQAALRAKSKAA